MAELKDIVKNYKKRLLNVAIESCDELSDRVVYRTPIDKGVLRKSWTPALNKFDNSNSGGVSSLATSRLKMGDDYTFTNAQPYARRIEYTGHSSQAPQGMLRISVAEWSSIVADAARRNNRGI